MIASRKAKYPNAEPGSFELLVPTVYVFCENQEFSALTLTGALTLWADNGRPRVLAIGTCGGTENRLEYEALKNWMTKP